MITVYCHSKCSTCRKALKWLEENSITFRAADIVTQHPDAAALEKLISISKKPIKSFFNTSGMLYKEMHLKEKLESMSDKEKLALLASDGMLIKRPLLISDDFVCPGFKEAEWSRLKSCAE